ncbi:hypothetical protein [Butyrivibrio sp. WCE2006]|uniref:hypothetical protein n=1 Tax=Butyrivibrio sp. WCE2006 TaxID=1410611 RepID=UPI0012DD10E0
MASHKSSSFTESNMETHISYHPDLNNALACFHQKMVEAITSNHSFYMVQLLNEDYNQIEIGCKYNDIECP